MSKKEFSFNTDTLTYEEIKEPFRMRVYRFLRKGLLFFIVVSIINIIFLTVFRTPKQRHIARDNEELLLRYRILNDKIDLASQKLEELGFRDAGVYRPLFGSDTLNLEGIYNPYPDSRYAYLDGDKYGYVMKGMWQKLDAVGRELYLRSKSLDEIQDLSMKTEQMAASIPAIWPVDRRNLRGHIGAFGGRFHPVHKVYRKHEGIDLGGSIGDPVYATGNAVVVAGISRGTGYGRQILLDHGFGYRTRYAHLNTILVEPGQVVRRGEQIGMVGNTGVSTGPHLHYEVIYMGKPVDPINYFRRDMSEEEFETIIQSVKQTTYESDF